MPSGTGENDEPPTQDAIAAQIADLLDDTVRTPAWLLSRRAPPAATPPPEITDPARKAALPYAEAALAADWAALARLLKTNDQKQTLYQGVLLGLAGEEHFLLPEDVLELAALDEDPPPAQRQVLLGKLLGRSLFGSTSHFLKRLDAGIGRYGGATGEGRRRVATLLLAADRPLEAGRFLPPLEGSAGAERLRLLDLHSRYALARAQGEEREHLPVAWSLHQELLQSEAVPQVRAEAMQRCLGLLEDLPLEEGDAWLRTVCANTALSDFLLAALAPQFSVDIYRADPVSRARRLRLFHRVLTGAEPVLAMAQAWREVSTWITKAWVDEVFYACMLADDTDDYQQRQQNQQRMLPTDVLPATAPSPAILAAIDPDLAEQVRLASGGSIVDSGDSVAGLALIASLQATQPKRAQDLATQLLSGWLRHSTGLSTQQHAWQQQWSQPWGSHQYYYGRQQAQGIPLTRAKQTKRLAGLAGLLRGIAGTGVVLPAEPVTSAFAACHSPAEVFRAEDIKAVFGDTLPPESALTLAGTMRWRLAGLWRKREVQQQAQTKRSDEELVAELRRGYDLARGMVEGPLLGGNWERLLLAAQLDFDRAEFDFGQQVDFADYSSRRDRAFKHFAAASAAGLARGKGGPAWEPLAAWFDAALGTSDLSYLTRQHNADDDQIQKLHTMIASRPPELRDALLGGLGVGFGQRLNQVPPQLKYRYLSALVQLLGEHPSARPLRERLQDYDGLRDELALELRLIGPEAVGTAPFAVELRLLHTTTVEREAGGFGRYLMDDVWVNNGQVDFRSDLETQVREVLGRRASIEELRFFQPTDGSMPDARPGWRATPLVHIVLRAKDGACDRLDPVQLDLDFADEMGGLILPVASPLLLVDAQLAPQSRPCQDLVVHQTLEQLADGNLRLEIQVRGKGLPPAVAEVLDASATRAEIVDHGDDELTIVELGVDAHGLGAVVERRASLLLRPAIGTSSFRFPLLCVAGATTTLRELLDGEVVDAEPEVAVLRPRAAALIWPWLLGLGVAGLAGLLWWCRRKRPAPRAQTALPPLPAEGNVLAAIRWLLQARALAEQRGSAEELDRDLQSLQRQHYGEASAGGAEAESRVVLSRWQDRLAVGAAPGSH